MSLGGPREATDWSESDAFARLIGAHQQAVRAFLRRLTGNHADADDLAQETFITAWRRPDEAKCAVSPRAWLCGVAYRKWLTRRRTDARRSVRDTDTLREAAPPGSPNPDARLDAARLLGALPEAQRAAVALCLAAGFTHEEAAHSLDLPLGTVKSHVLRGRAKLLALIGGADDQR